MHTHTYTHTLYIYIYIYIVQLEGNTNLVKLSLWIYFAKKHYYTLHLVRWLYTLDLKLQNNKCGSLSKCVWKNKKTKGRPLWILNSQARAKRITTIIIKLCHQHGYPWPSLTTPPYHSSPPAGLQSYILCLHIAAVCSFELIVLLLLGHMWGSIGVHHLRARPCFSSSVLRVWFV